MDEIERALADEVSRTPSEHLGDRVVTRDDSSKAILAQQCLHRLRAFWTHAWLIDARNVELNLMGTVASNTNVTRLRRCRNSPIAEFDAGSARVLTVYLSAWAPVFLVG